MVRALLRAACAFPCVVTSLVGTSTLILPLSICQSEAQTVSRPPGPLDETLLGKWTYRSFRSNPAQGTPVDQLLFAEGTIEIQSTANGIATGTFDFGPGYQMQFRGSLNYGNPATLQFQAKGTSDATKDWLYDYRGYLVLEWPHSVDQRPALVGSVIRSAPHAAGNGGVAPAGVVASWIAVKQDAAKSDLTLSAGAAPRLLRSPVLAQKPATMKDGFTDTMDPLRAAWAEMMSPSTPTRPSSLLRQQMDALESELKRKQPAAAFDALKNERFLPLTQRKSLAMASVTEFENPSEFKSVDGKLHATLEVKYAENKIGNDTVWLRSYNGKLVGPTLRCKPGDTLYITLVNSLPPQPEPTEQEHNKLNGFNYTNLHFHGLHVSPTGKKGEWGDNVLLTLAPRKVDADPSPSEQYKIEIPKDHPCGVYWYHAHRHGSVAGQVASGMAGAIVIESDKADQIDQVPGIKEARQEVLVLQQIPYVMEPNSNGSVPPQVGVVEQDAPVDLFGPGAWDESDRFTTINGLKQPVFKLRPGEVVRWRAVAAGFREDIELRLDREKGSSTLPANLPLHEIAADGIPIGKRKEQKDIELWPGYRSEFLIQAPNEECTYLLVDATVDSGGDRKILGRVEVSGTPVAMSLPDSDRLKPFRPASIPTDKINGYQTARFGLHFTPGQPPQFTFNNAQYSASNPGVTLELGKTEEWTVLSDNRRNGQLIPPGTIHHPFHIHVNAFEVTSIKNDKGEETLDEPVWRDTIIVKHGYTVKFRTKYEDFAGEFVQHCHILDHEDQGMMTNVRILDPNAPVVPPISTMKGTPPLQASALPPVLTPFLGKPLLVAVVRTLDCGGCQEQIAQLERACREKGWPRTLIVAPDSQPRVDEARRDGDVKQCEVVSDPNFTVLNYIDATAKRENRGHALMLLDPDGAPIFKSASLEPTLDVQSLRSQFVAIDVEDAVAGVQDFAQEANPPRVVISVWGTPSDKDDYITWAPTRCTIRLEDATEADVDVTLTNDPQGPIPSDRTEPLDGDVAFAATLASGQTAKEEVLRLRLPKDGTEVPFFIAGKFKRPSSKDKDCIIEAHQGSADGPLIGSHALMVRVRKDHRKLTDFEKQRFLESLDYLQRTAKSPDGNGSLYMYFVRMHKASAVGLDFDPDMPAPVPAYAWPDLSHKGPGFISWHRAFLLEFERAIQEKYPEVALPYWVMPESSELFTEDFLGANPVGGPTPVNAKFSPNNPIFGWTADIDGSVNQQIQRHAYGRNPGDARFGPFFKDDDLFTLKAYSFYPRRVNQMNLADPNNSFAAMLESNPHNSGHNWVGPWMQNCQTSPRDPIFWAFHTGFDRQWAKWQVRESRFNPDGTGDSFCPPGTFEQPGSICNPATPPPPKNCDDLAPNGCVPVNHRLMDELWPWNGKFGKASTVKGSYPQEDLARPFLRPFPAAPIPGLWPEKAQKITNGDMIDFMGKTPQRLPMGFCYDDTPYDKSELLPEVATPNFVAQAEQASTPRARLNRAASMSLRGTQAEQQEADTSLKEMESSETMDTVSRQSALRILTHRGDTERPFRIARSQEQKDRALKPEALRLMTEHMMFSPDGVMRKKEVMTELQKGLSASEPEVRTAALWSLLSTGESKEAVQALSNSLETPEGAAFSPDQAIKGLMTAGKSKEKASLIRPLLKHSNPTIAAVAASALSGDAESRNERLELINNPTASKEARSSALQSLSSNNAENLKFLAQFAADSKQDGRLRAEATAILGAWARTYGVQFDRQLWQDARATIGGISDAATNGFEPALSRAVRSLTERLADAVK